jgi:hypothetical protein
MKWWRFLPKILRYHNKADDLHNILRPTYRLWILFQVTPPHPPDLSLRGKHKTQEKKAYKIRPGIGETTRGTAQTTTK